MKRNSVNLVKKLLKKKFKQYFINKLDFYFILIYYCRKKQQ